jgi:hypothetical protein
MILKNFELWRISQHSSSWIRCCFQLLGNKMVGERGLEPPRTATQDPKSNVVDLDSFSFIALL